MRKVFVTGIGIISAVGNNVRETIASVQNSRSGIGNITLIDTIYKNLPFAEVKCNNSALFKKVGIEEAESFSRTALLSMVAAREALLYSKINDIAEWKTGLISSTTVGGMDKSELYYEDFLTNNSRNNYIDIHDCADHTEKIADYLGINEYLTTISTACSSSANSIMFAARLIRNGTLDRAIAGGSECLSKFHIDGFYSLQILDTEPCKPFDAFRNGLTLGEGAAYLVLESEEAVKTSGKTILCELSGWGNACEAYHQTASSPEGYGAVLAMQKALAVAGLQPSQISYINAHGTGTQNNDASEGNAIETVFGNNIPPVSSTKSFTGHTTSAAGAVEGVLCILAMNRGWLLPNLNFTHKMENTHFEPVRKLQTNIKFRHILSNSFGFGGNDSCLIFSKV
ncbi:MAG: beta-ketoacyl-[acyl-carrier-protein] synthase family protein [Lentimicrobiaceae bacterium]|jgi:3-oxoacyl-[acyl-carrier-protein] synthase-1|nr:beta-ketoacyl-[acyl-carrier-protein] synthase family protein [Lentimicrobiaceae bacterium]